MVLALIIGAQTFAADKKAKVPPKDVEVFSGGNLPDRTYAELKTFTDDITLSEEAGVTRNLVKKAQGLHADALIVWPLVETGAEFHPFQGVRRTFAYKAVAVRFTGPPGSAPRPTVPPTPPPANGSAASASKSTPELDGSGTGFFITPDGYLVTNEHVVHNAALIRVLHDGKVVDAKLVKTDPNNDLALLKTELKVAALPIGSSKSLKLGDPVLTVGFPLPHLQGQEPKLTRGDISGLSGFRDDPSAFQISTPIQPGNSGGPLVDRRGNVVGVIVSKLARLDAQNVNYAVKSIYLKALLETVAQIPEESFPRPFEAEKPDREIIDLTVSNTVQVLRFK
jgi:S1-C subfamily serine protease